MDFKDFKIGLHFYTTVGRWIVTDVGTRIVVARRAHESHWDDANNVVFCWYDFGGCTRKPQRGLKKASVNNKINWTVARAMGWQADGPYWSKKEGRITLKSSELPAYTTDMQAAWQIVEHMVKNGGCPALIHDDNGHWALSLEGVQTVPFMGKNAETLQTAFWIEKGKWTDSAPLAICKALLEQGKLNHKLERPSSKRASRKHFEKALAKAPARPLEAQDRL